MVVDREEQELNEDDNQSPSPPPRRRGRRPDPDLFWDDDSDLGHLSTSVTPTLITRRPNHSRTVHHNRSASNVAKVPAASTTTATSTHAATATSTLGRLALHYHNRYMWVHVPGKIPYIEVRSRLGARPGSELLFTLAAVTSLEFTKWLKDHKNSMDVAWGPMTVRDEVEWREFLDVLEDFLGGQLQDSRIGVNVE